MYAPVLEVEGYQFLIDCRDLWRPPAVLVDRGPRRAEVWLGDEVTLRRASGYIDSELDQIVELVQEYQEDLLDAWHNLREDVRRGRLRKRNHIIE